LPERRVCGLFIEAEKEKLTRNLTLNLRCRSNVWSVRQWSLGKPTLTKSPEGSLEGS
jgi:hypothetical protein